MWKYKLNHINDIKARIVRLTPDLAYNNNNNPWDLYYQGYKK